MSLKEIYYVGMVNTPAYSRYINERLYIGAGFKKMSSIILAMRSANISAHLLSLPVLESTSSKSRVAKIELEEDGFHCILLPTYRNRIARKILGSLHIAFYLAFSIPARSTVIVYNHSFEYILALVFLAIKRTSVFHDIEDLPVRTDKSSRGLLNLACFWVTSLLTNRRKIVVSHQIARSLRLNGFLVLPGVYSYPSDSDCLSKAKWDNLNNGSSLRVHYGGTLSSDTGLDLFLRTLEALDSSDSLDRHISFFVTGIGDIHKVSLFKPLLVNPKLSLHVLPNADLAAYERIICSCHVSLSLKSPYSPLATTTFPSKLVEAASRRLALVSSDIKDVKAIFDGGSAYFLNEYNPECLFQALIDLSQTPQSLFHRACLARDVVKHKLSPALVGNLIKDFLDG